MFAALPTLAPPGRVWEYNQDARRWECVLYYGDFVRRDGTRSHRYIECWITKEFLLYTWDPPTALRMTLHQWWHRNYPQFELPVMGQIMSPPR